LYTMKSGKITPSRTFWASVPPWLIIGCALILVPIFVVMTLQSIAKQRELTTRLLIEKGEAIIRSFEAGSRTGAGMQWGSFQLQKLLIETAEQPGVDYLILTDRKGVILADSDPSMIGESYGADLDLKNGPSKADPLAESAEPRRSGHLRGVSAPRISPRGGVVDLRRPGHEPRSGRSEAGHPEYRPDGGDPSFDRLCRHLLSLPGAGLPHGPDLSLPRQGLFRRPG